MVRREMVEADVSDMIKLLLLSVLFQFWDEVEVGNG
jgi:hypothetical protein